MAEKSGSSYTAPKGRATASRSDTGRGRRLSPAVEWALVIVGVAAVVGAIIWFGRDAGDNSPHNGLGASEPAVVTVVDSAA